MHTFKAPGMPGKGTEFSDSTQDLAFTPAIPVRTALAKISFLVSSGPQLLPDCKTTYATGEMGP